MAKVESDEEVPDSPTLPVTSRASNVIQKSPDEIENINRVILASVASSQR